MLQHRTYDKWIVVDFLNTNLTRLISFKKFNCFHTIRKFVKNTIDNFYESLLIFFVHAYPVLLTHAAGILEIACPCQTQSTHLEIPIREHVSQTECVIILLYNKANINVLSVYSNHLVRILMYWYYVILRLIIKQTIRQRGSLPEKSSKYFSTP